MKPAKLYLSALLALSVLVTSSCKNDKDSSLPTGNYQEIKYEVTDNFFEGIFIVYPGKTVSAGTLVKDIMPPWCKAITYNSYLPGTGKTGQPNTNSVVSQTVKLKIYAGCTVVTTRTVTANNAGQTNLPTFPCSFLFDRLFLIGLI